LRNKPLEVAGSHYNNPEKRDEPAGGLFVKKLVDSYFEGLYAALENVQYTGQQGEQLDRAEAYERALRLAMEATDRGCKLMFVGNGGSAAIASHMAIDFTKNGGMPAVCFNDGAALTCMGNDFGYEEVFAGQLRSHARKGDVLIAISSSGRSENILRAVAVARSRGCAVITMSGFKPGNPLRALGDVNFHLGSCEYGLVEVAHTAMIHALVDLKMANSPMAGARLSE
jgi:D-sedoheptulose 7-phosphate isomerase